MTHKNVIPDETMKIIWDFFMKTSIPRLIESKRKEEAQKEETR